MFPPNGNPAGASPFLVSTLGSKGDFTPISGKWYIVASSSMFSMKAFIGNNLFLYLRKKIVFFLYSFCFLNGHLAKVIEAELNLKLLIVCKENCLKAPATPDI